MIVKRNNPPYHTFSAKFPRLVSETRVLFNPRLLAVVEFHFMKYFPADVLLYCARVDIERPKFVRAIKNISVHVLFKGRNNRAKIILTKVVN